MHRTRQRFELFLSLGLLLLLAPRCLAQEAAPNSPDFSAMFDKQDAMIPARDGVKLHTEIYTPKNIQEALPIILERTPYGTSDDDKGYSRLLVLYSEMIPDGYIFVFQDIRGRYGSEGQFVMQRPVRDPKDPKAIDEGTDTWDTIDWMVKNVPHNSGSVGLLGISYGGWLTVMGMLEPHPALKAVSEQASPADMFLGDDFHHNGAFRLSYGFEYSTMMETGKTNFAFAFDRFDTYDWYLRLGPLSNANAKYIHGSLPTWNDFTSHPNYDDFWKAQAMAYLLKKPTVPNLNVAGWWDQEDFYGPMKIYEILEKNDPESSQLSRRRSLESWRMGPRPRQSSRRHPLRQRYQRLLSPKNPGALVCLLAQGKRQSFPSKRRCSFRPAATLGLPSTLGLHAKRKPAISISAKTASSLSIRRKKSDPTSGFDSYVSDPAHPVPYRHRPIDMTYPDDHPGGWSTWLVEDQRFVDRRPDVLTWQTPTP